MREFRTYARAFVQSSTTSVTLLIIFANSLDSGITNVGPDLGSNRSFENINFEQNQDMTKKRANLPSKKFKSNPE